ncbi:MAG: SurA N-terminal domain-containing protein [Spirochaetes bacterium]|nr:SurA N-terminal domain-containing protein [Spirochaetota bacterium]MBN2771672.1 SurA N-terminal domain-containing protein [Spirochaetota bacterium]
MVKSKNIVVKVFSYILVGILTILLVVSLGSPGLMDKAMLNQNTLAAVNGKKIDVQDFGYFLNTDQRFYNRASEIRDDEQLLNYARSVYLQRVLTIQYAQEIGIVVVDDQVVDYISSLGNFKDEDGKFMPDRLDQFLKYYNMSYNQFFKRTYDVLVLRELDNLIVNGTGVSPDDIRMDKTVNNSKITLRYGFLSNAAIKKRYPERLTVSEKEIDDEVERLKETVTEPIDDTELLKKQAKNELEVRKLSELKLEISSKINSLALEGKPFTEGLAVLDVKAEDSKPFKIGSPVYSAEESKGLLLDLYTNSVFYEDCLKVKQGELARAVDVSSGLYVFTPIEKIVPFDKDGELTAYDSYMAHQERSLFVENALLSPFIEKSRVIRNY